MPDLTSEAIARATGAPLANVRDTWPLVLAEMQRWDVASLPSQIGMAATIGVETPAFKPIRELRASAMRQPALYAQQDRYWSTGYYGRGLIQTTWEINYRKFQDAEGLPVLATPDLLLQPGPAALAAVFYWRHKGLAPVCDAGQWERVRRLVNGGLNGWDRFIQIVRRLQAPAAPTREG